MRVARPKKNPIPASGMNSTSHHEKIGLSASARSSNRTDTPINIHTHNADNTISTNSELNIHTYKGRRG